MRLQDAVPFAAGPVVASSRKFSDGILKEMRDQGVLKVFPVEGPTVFTIENDHNQEDGFVGGGLGDRTKEKEAIEKLLKEVEDRHERG